MSRLANGDAAHTNGHSAAKSTDQTHRVDYTVLYPFERTREEEDTLEGCCWFDIDNCLYSKSRGIAPLMSKKIHDYFIHMGMPEAEAWEKHMHYYKYYGLAIRGLQEHYPDFDAEDFDRKCDGSLPLEELLSEDETLQQLLKSIDRKKVKVMALTNAYKPHALRVLRILGVTDLFEGVISCQYPVKGFPGKPDRTYYEIAMQICGMVDPSKHYFVDDSLLNCKGAKAVGWNVWLFDEDSTHTVEPGAVNGTIRSLEELRELWLQFIKA